MSPGDTGNGLEWLVGILETVASPGRDLAASFTVFAIFWVLACTIRAFLCVLSRPSLTSIVTLEIKESRDQSLRM